MAELIEDIRKPISEASPCGDDVKYDDDYESLQAEMNKTAGNDWEQVVKLGHAILAEKSKDLNVATWLCVGLLQLEGFEGLAAGLEGYQILLQNYWENLYPSKIRSRAAAVQILNNRLGGDQKTAGLIEVREATPKDVEALEKIRDTVKVLRAEVQEKVGSVSLANIATAIEEKLKSVSPSKPSPARPVSERPPVPKPEPPKETASAASTQRPQQPAEQPKPAIPTAWTRPNEAIATITQAAAYLRRQNPKDAMPYRLLRSARWDTWQELPEDWSDQIPLQLPEGKESKAHLEALVKSENWEALLNQAEELFAVGNTHFWLDLQRYIALALNRLDGDYKAAYTAVLRETAMFVERLPKLIDLSYRGGPAFADPETKTWIQQEVLPILSGGRTITQNTQSQNSEVTTEQRPEVSSSTAQTSQQQIRIGGDGAQVEIQIRVYTN